LIAREKAGIIKSNTPVIIGELDPETRVVFEEKSATMQAPVFFAQEEWFITDYQTDNSTQLKVKDTQGKVLEIALDLRGIYQLKNVLSVLSAVQQLRKAGWNIPAADLKFALSHVQILTGLSGRWQVWEKDPRIVLDVGHNEDGVRQITEQIKITDFEQLHIIIGMVKDKDIRKVLRLLPDHASYYFTQASIPRALAAEELLDQATNYHLKGDAFMNIGTAVETAVRNANPKDMILICGSVFLVGEAIQYLERSKTN
jgi:dihydrofolate synthase/folylpolyglutamate synthase